VHPHLDSRALARLQHALAGRGGHTAAAALDIGDLHPHRVDVGHGELVNHLRAARLGAEVVAEFLEHLLGPALGRGPDCAEGQRHEGQYPVPHDLFAPSTWVPGTPGRRARRRKPGSTHPAMSAADLTDNLPAGKGGFTLARRRGIPYEGGRTPRMRGMG